MSGNGFWSELHGTYGRVNEAAGDPIAARKLSEEAVLALMAVGQGCGVRDCDRGKGRGSQVVCKTER